MTDFVFVMQLSDFLCPYLCCSALAVSTFSDNYTTFIPCLLLGTYVFSYVKCRCKVSMNLSFCTFSFSEKKRKKGTNANFALYPIFKKTKVGEKGWEIY